MIANQTEYSRFEQRSVIKYLVIEMFDVYGGACFSKILLHVVGFYFVSQLPRSL